MQLLAPVIRRRHQSSAGAPTWRRPVTFRLALENCARSCLRSVAGAAAVEMALVLPVALLLLTGTAQAGYMLFVYNNMLHVAQEAARSVAVDVSTATEAKSWAEGKLSSYGYGFTADISEAGGEVAVDISVPLISIAIIDPFGLFKTGSLNAAATAKDQS